MPIDRPQIEVSKPQKDKNDVTMLSTPRIKPVTTNLCSASDGRAELVEIGPFKCRNSRNNALFEARLADCPISGNSMVVRRIFLFGSGVLISLSFRVRV